MVRAAGRKPGGRGNARDTRVDTPARYRARLVRAFLTALECVDAETSAHCQRVARYAVALTNRYVGGQFGPPLTIACTPRIEDVELGALLHDIGKINVPQHILLKPGPLTILEQVEMRRHVEYGGTKIAAFPELSPALDIVLHHHERWDGSGYPRGLMFDQIPLAARIFSVCDAYDAMTSARPYRGALCHQAACLAIQDGADRQFDAQVVEAFLSIPESEWRALALLDPDPTDFEGITTGHGRPT